ncbi:MAG: hypothetical protein RLZZ469_1665 [Bacteroidota bacterium]|jgi:hypothetical protein
MKDLPKSLSTYEFCKGQSPDGTKVCGYRDQCKRYLEGGYRVIWKDFWRAGDDCNFYQGKGIE